MAEAQKNTIFSELSKLPPEKREAALSFLMAQKTRRSLTPNHCSIELTPLCPFSCKMCYIKEEGLKPGATKLMLTGEQWEKIIDQIAAQGLESVTLTGGEIFSYPDFQQVYQYTYDKGLEIILMSNALLIDEKAVAWLVKMPPKFICVTLYGASADSYGRLCGMAEGYEKVVSAIERMKKAGLPVILQSTITKDNYTDLEAMIAFAKKREIAYRYSANLFAARECTSNCAVAEIAELPGDAERRKKIITKLQSGEMPKQEIITHGTLCGAGRNSYHINWRGEMQSCILMDMYRVSVLTNTVEEAWQEIRDWTKQIPQLIECQQCPAYKECGDHCLASHYAESGSFGKPAFRRCIKQQLEEAQSNEKDKNGHS